MERILWLPTGEATSESRLKQIIDEKNRLTEELEEKELSESQCKQTQLSLKTQLTSTIKLLHDETNVS